VTEIMTGGCHCGHVRYEADFDDFDGELCHCRMCQRTSGNVFMALKTVRKAALRWLSEPVWYESSPIARRPFCDRCGTSLGFGYVDSETFDVSVGSLDDPSRVVPVVHFGVESRHEAWMDTRGLKDMRCDEYDQLIDRWAKSGQEMPS
jgi:hypothetical protein